MAKTLFLVPFLLLTFPQLGFIQADRTGFYCLGQPDPRRPPPSYPPPLENPTSACTLAQRDLVAVSPQRPLQYARNPPEGSGITKVPLVKRVGNCQASLDVVVPSSEDEFATSVLEGPGNVLIRSCVEQRTKWGGIILPVGPLGVMELKIWLDGISTQGIGANHTIKEMPHLAIDQIARS